VQCLLLLSSLVISHLTAPHRISALACLDAVPCYCKYCCTAHLSRCTDTVVNCLCTSVFEQICHVLDALRLRGLSHCTVYCGPVRGSVYVEDCSDCTIVVACRQLRIHTTYRTDMYVHTLSGPIIEDCNAIR
jgi:Tubulin binding cofactor C